MITAPYKHQPPNTSKGQGVKISASSDVSKLATSTSCKNSSREKHKNSCQSKQRADKATRACSEENKFALPPPCPGSSTWTREEEDDGAILSASAPEEDGASPPSNHPWSETTDPSNGPDAQESFALPMMGQYDQSQDPIYRSANTPMLSARPKAKDHISKTSADKKKNKVSFNERNITVSVIKSTSKGLLSTSFPPEMKIEPHMEQSMSSPGVSRKHKKSLAGTQQGRNPSSSKQKTTIDKDTHPHTAWGSCRKFEPEYIIYENVFPMGELDFLHLQEKRIPDEQKDKPRGKVRSICMICGTLR